MRRVLYSVIYSSVLFVSCLPAADWFESVVDFGIGYRLDQFEWSINDPIFGLKEVDLKWKKLEIIDFLASVKITACDLIYWRINGDWGSIYLGRNKYTAFELDPPSIISESRSCSNGSWVFDGTTGVGFHIGCRESHIQLSPMVGYSVHGQKLLMRDGRQVFGPLPFLGVIPHLHVNYEAIWDGPWLGADLEIDLCGGWHIIGQGEWHWARYHGYGVWRRNRFCMRYTDTASATGYVFLAGINYCSTPNWSFGLMGTLQRFHTTRRWNKHVINEVESLLLPEEEFIGALPGRYEDTITSLRNITWRSVAIFFTFDTYF